MGSITELGTRTGQLEAVGSWRRPRSGPSSLRAFASPWIHSGHETAWSRWATCPSSGHAGRHRDSEAATSAPARTVSPLRAGSGNVLLPDGLPLAHPVGTGEPSLSDHATPLTLSALSPPRDRRPESAVALDRPSTRADRRRNLSPGAPARRPTRSASFEIPREKRALEGLSRTAAPVNRTGGGSWIRIDWLPRSAGTQTSAGRIARKIPWSFRRVRTDPLAAENAPSPPANPIRKARLYEQAIAGGAKSYRQVAEQFGVTRQEVCQYLTLLRRLPAELARRVETETRPEFLREFSYRKLLAHARTTSRKP